MALGLGTGAGDGRVGATLPLSGTVYATLTSQIKVNHRDISDISRCHGNGQVYIPPPYIPLSWQLTTML